MATIRCALLDRERKVYLGMTEVDESAIDPEIHLPQITDCDLPANTYRWVAEVSAEFGGRFEPLPREQRAKPGAATLEVAFAFQMLATFARDQGAVADVTLSWLDGVVATMDFRPYVKTPLVAAYVAARGLDLSGGR